MTWKSFLLACLLGLGLPLNISTSAQANNFIISNTSGTVEIRWRFSLFWRRARQYAELSPLHHVRVGEQSSVTITCLDSNANWVDWTVNSKGEVPISEYCSNPYPERTTAPERSPIDETLPYIISPRNTALLPGSTSITWNDNSDVNAYRVTIQGRGLPWQSGWLTETTTQLPPSLEIGRTYEISVETDQGGSSNPSNSASPTFTILTDAKVRIINQKLAQAEALKLDSTTQALVLARIYLEHNLNQNAITLLEEQIQQGQQSVAIYQLQALIYEQIGLNKRAQQRYENALELTDASDLEQQASIQESLGLLARSVANHAEAVRWLQSAEDIYQEQLDISIPDVQSRLQELRALIEDSQVRIPLP